ncbi:hypothetical protein [Helicobacter ailurogastricus]|uniref:hypothetical protein n=1 Tax=Helicobacter ailurogastricus TaxID=1578720 RepID=UPI001F1BC8B5|nr:hypothetical protein [Helicobacter ailurogastricus]
MKTNAALNALNSATQNSQALEQAQNLSKSLEDLEMLLNALQESHAPLLQGTSANTSHNTAQSTQTAKSTTAPEVKPLWQMGRTLYKPLKITCKPKTWGVPALG